MSEQDAMSVDKKSTRSKKSASVGPEKVVLSRGDKDEFVAWLSTRLGDANFRRAFLESTHLAKARGVVRSAAAKASFAKAARGLEHPATFADLVAKSASKARLSDTERAALLRHWQTLQHAAKGSKKILERRVREGRNAGRTNFRKKQTKHQSRH